MYTINVTNFSKHNQSLKKGHKSTLISNNFCTDSRLGVLPVSHRWMFLGLLLMCGNHTSDTVEVNERQLRDLLESSKSIERALDSLQSLQLLSYSKNEILLNRKEKKVKEKILKELPDDLKSPDFENTDFDEIQKPEKIKQQKLLKVVLPENKTFVHDAQKALNAEIWESYKNAYFQRWKVEPTRNAKVNTNIKQLGLRLGTDAVSVVEFYLKHNDSNYLRNQHPIGLCLTNAEGLHTQWKIGKPITQNDVRNFEKKINELEVKQALASKENF